jgi:hypothetical protein
VYEGSFRKDTLHGEGKLTHANGDYYEGEWENGLKHGYGIYDLNSVGLRYQGYWREVKHPRFAKLMIQDKKHGVGWIIYPDGLQYKGEFVDDEPAAEESTSSTGSPVRLLSTRNSPTDDRGSIESSHTERTRNTGSSSPSVGPSKTAHADTPATKPKTKSVNHQRSRSFAEIVGRKIKDPSTK